jgi:agmatinase
MTSDASRSRPPHGWFLDIDAESARDPRAPCAVLPLPYERTVSFGPGAANGPAAILDASHEVEDFDEELRAPLALAVQTLPAPQFDGLGDEAALAAIERAAAPELAAGRFLLSLGGEHSVTAPLVRAAAALHPGLTVLHLDAHLDLRDRYEGTPHSHACVMRRVRELGLETVHVGVRSWSAEEQSYAARHDLRPVTARGIAADRRGRWIGEVIGRLGPLVYATVDVDVLDPSLVPGTGTPEPGGPGWAEVLALLRRVFAEREVVAADIVELAPIPGSRVSEFVAARLGAKMLLYRGWRERQ